MDTNKMLARYQSNQCTEQEARRLFAHIKSGKDRKLIEKFIEENLHDPSTEKAIDENGSLLEEAFEKIISRVNVRQALGRKAGTFIFTGNGFKKVLFPIAVWYDIALVCKNAKVPAMKIGGK
ncbi:hypothetical protein G8759_10265 [Spirosoma aureum]|uniref:Uncharacterized protein n=1 Tax=Spirosoma aureum TaxID=2692134 RepID=A0A6G9AKI7_9BACT|nr:hypothetical protein [Spirosoma aureum]QIP12981.1 hypothetical protein G8759_10265 [Spirosoma aureum]